MQIILNKKQVSDFKILLSVLKKISLETYFKITKDEMILRAFDPSNAMYYNTILTSDSFEKYEIETDIDGQINISEMEKYLKMFKDDLILSIDNNQFLLTSKTRKTKLPIYEIENDIRTLIKTDDDFDTILIIESDDFTNMMSDIGMGNGTGIAFNITKESLKLSNNNVVVHPESNVDIEKGDIEYTNKYNYSYLKQCVLNKLVSNLKLRIGKENLLSIIADGNGVKLEIIIAPLGE